MIMTMNESSSSKRNIFHDGLPESSLNKRVKLIEEKRPSEERNELNREIEDVNLNTFSEKMYFTYVTSALDSMDKDDSLQIDTLTTKINLPMNHEHAISLSNFSIVLKALISNIYKLDNSCCSKLISSILEYEWVTINFKVVDRDSYLKFIDLYSHFLSVLVSSIPKYLHDVLTKLVGEFSVIDPEGQSDIKHHKIIAQILKIVPTSVNTLPGILRKNFPHHLSSSTSELIYYIGNTLKILDFCGELQYNIWQQIFDCSIKLDVELQNELDELDDDEIEELINNDEIDDQLGNEFEHEVNTLTNVEDLSDNLEGDDYLSEGEIQYMNDPLSNTHNIKKLSKKLDAIICLILRRTEGRFTSVELENGNGVALFNIICSLFKSHILPTHFTKSIQFVLFHVSQQRPELSDSFLVLLIDIAFNKSVVLERRLKAMQYLSSYIARAKSLSKSQVVFVVTYLVEWLNKYISERECEISEYSNMQQKKAAGMERFKLFYVAFQTLLYVFCFRFKHLYKEEKNDDIINESEWECELDKFFQRVIIAKFNPLKYCDETVVFIFAKIATKLNVCYCYSIIEHNKRERMLQTSGASLPLAVSNFNQKQEFLDLEAYFPFDPLVLPKSNKIVTINYIHWSDVNPHDDDDDDDSVSASQSDFEESASSNDEPSSGEYDD